MDVIRFTRQLVDIESISGSEGPVGNFLFEELTHLGFRCERIPVEGERNNVWATWPEEPRPAVVFSTHMDIVPPHIPSSEDETRVYGRGSCDAKGIIAIQTAAAERLRKEGIQALTKLPAMKLPENLEVGPCTLNIGLIEGGRAPNVIPDKAKALLLYRLVGPSTELRRQSEETVAGLADVDFTLEIPFQKLR